MIWTQIPSLPPQSRIDYRRLRRSAKAATIPALITYLRNRMPRLAVQNTNLLIRAAEDLETLGAEKVCVSDIQSIFPKLTRNYFRTGHL